MQPALFEEGQEEIIKENGLVVENAVVLATDDGLAQLVVTNFSGFTQTVTEGIPIGCAEVVAVLKPDSETSTCGDTADVKRLNSCQEEWRRRKTAGGSAVAPCPRI